MNFYYYSGLNTAAAASSERVRLRYEPPLFQSSSGVCTTGPLVSGTPILRSLPGRSALDLIVAPSAAVVSLLGPQMQTSNFASGGAIYRFKTPYVIWSKQQRGRNERIDKSVKCEMCKMLLNSERQAKQHYNGKHHLRKLRKMMLNSTASNEQSTSDLKGKHNKPSVTAEKKHHKSADEDAAADAAVDADDAEDVAGTPAEERDIQLTCVNEAENDRLANDEHDVETTLTGISENADSAEQDHLTFQTPLLSNQSPDILSFLFDSPCKSPNTRFVTDQNSSFIHSCSNSLSSTDNVRQSTNPQNSSSFSSSSNCCRAWETSSMSSSSHESNPVPIDAAGDTNPPQEQAISLPSDNSLLPILPSLSHFQF